MIEVGFKDIKISFDQKLLDRLGEEALDEAMTDGCEKIVKFAKANHPYTDRSNKNTDSIQWEKDGKLGWKVFTDSYYGGWLEIGRDNIPAFPYIYPAYKACIKEIIESLKIKDNK